MLEVYRERTLVPDGAEAKVKEFSGPTLRRNQKKRQRLFADLHKRGVARTLDARSGQGSSPHER